MFEVEESGTEAKFSKGELLQFCCLFLCITIYPPTYQPLIYIYREKVVAPVQSMLMMALLQMLHLLKIWCQLSPVSLDMVLS